jgi:hypothetical protein
MILSWCGLVMLAAVQGTTPSRVTIPQSVGPAGGSVAVPVQLAAAEGVEIGSITLTVRFASSQLTFDKVEIGGLGESVGAKATATVESNGEEARLEVTITTEEKDGARPPLPDGPLVHLMFTLDKGLKPESVIPVETEASAAGPTSRSGPIPLQVRGGEIIVSNPGVVGCFFYMH